MRLAVAVRDASRQWNLNINRGPAVEINWLSQYGVSLMIVYDLCRTRLLLTGTTRHGISMHIAKMSVCAPFIPPYSISVPLFRVLNANLITCQFFLFCTLKLRISISYYFLNFPTALNVDVEYFPSLVSPPRQIKIRFFIVLFPSVLTAVIFYFNYFSRAIFNLSFSFVGNDIVLSPILFA